MSDEAQRRCLLIVDDDIGARTTLAAFLEKEGFDVDTAGSGVEAIKKSNERYFDFVLTETSLPDMEGTDILRAMRNATPKTFKLIATGHPSLGSAIKAVNEGVDGYFLKPVDNDVLLSSIRKHLESRAGEVEFGELKVAEFIKTRMRELGDLSLSEPPPARLESSPASTSPK